MTSLTSLPSFADDALIDLAGRLRNPMWVHSQTGAPYLDSVVTQQDLSTAADVVDAVLRDRAEVPLPGAAPSQAADTAGSPGELERLRRELEVERQRSAQMETQIDLAYDKAAAVAKRLGNDDIAAKIVEEKGWEGLDCSCGGGWKAGHQSGCPEDESRLAANATGHDLSDADSRMPMDASTGIDEDLRTDAERWRAFIGSDRFTAMGWTSAFKVESGGSPIVSIDPEHDEAGAWIHFTLNIWDQHPAGDDAQGVHGRRMLLAYVDHLVDRARRQKGEEPLAQRSSIPDATYTVYVPAGWRLVPLKLTDTMCLHVTMNDDPNIAWERAVEDAPNPPFANTQVDALQFRLDRRIEENEQQRESHNAIVSLLSTAAQGAIDVLSSAAEQTEMQTNVVAILREGLEGAKPTLRTAVRSPRDHG